MFTAITVMRGSKLSFLNIFVQVTSLITCNYSNDLVLVVKHSFAVSLISPEDSSI
jgi:hypothetical protein